MICRRLLPGDGGVSGERAGARAGEDADGGDHPRTLLAARPPPRSTRRLNRPRPARDGHRCGRRMGLLQSLKELPRTWTFCAPTRRAGPRQEKGSCPARRRTGSCGQGLPHK